MRSEEDVIVKNVRLYSGNQELGDANKFLKTASAFGFRIRPGTLNSAPLLDEDWNRFTVEFIFQKLKNKRGGGVITFRGYHQSTARGMSGSGPRGVALVEHIREVNCRVCGCVKCDAPFSVKAST